MKMALVMFLKATVIIVIAFRIFQTMTAIDTDWMQIHFNLKSELHTAGNLKKLAVASLAVVNLCLCYGVTCSVEGPVWLGLVVNYGKNLVASFTFVVWKTTPWYLGFSERTTKHFFNLHHMSAESAFILALGADHIMLVFIHIVFI